MIVLQLMLFCALFTLMVKIGVWNNGRSCFNADEQVRKG